MFYSDSQINNIIICELCKNKLSDPRNVPCGRTFCNDCIIQSSDNDFKCICEKERHEIPEEGFPRALAIANLLNQNPIGVSRGKIVEELMAKLEELINGLNDIQNSYDRSECRIIQHCDSIKNQIDLATETAIQNIQNQRETLLEKVNQHQKECLENLVHESSAKSKLEKSLKEKKDFYENWQIKFEQHKIDDFEVRNALTTCKNYLRLLSEDHYYLKRYTHNNKIISFDQKTDKIKLIGNLYFGSCDFVRFFEPKKIDLGSMGINTDRFIYDFDIGDDEKVLICLSEDDRSLLRICIYDSIEGKLEIINEIDHYSNPHSIRCYFFQEDKIVLMMNYEDKVKKQPLFFILSIVDLKVTTKTSIKSNILDFHCNSKYIYCLSSKNQYSSRNNKYIIQIYDELMNNQKNLSIQDFEINDQISSIKVNENYIFLMDQYSKLALYSVVDGSFVKKISLDEKRFSLYYGSFIVSIGDTLSAINFHDFEGEKISSYYNCLELADLRTSLIKGSKNGILVKDEKSNRIYFY